MDTLATGSHSDSERAVSTKGIPSGQNLLLFDPQNPFAAVHDVDGGGINHIMPDDFDPKMSVPAAK